jgi:hypothetical protein
MVPGALSPAIKRPGREIYHSPATGAEVKNTWLYAFTPPYAFMLWCLISEAEENFFSPHFFIGKGFQN